MEIINMESGKFDKRFDILALAGFWEAIWHQTINNSGKRMCMHVTSIKFLT